MTLPDEKLCLCVRSSHTHTHTHTQTQREEIFEFYLALTKPHSFEQAADLTMSHGSPFYLENFRPGPLAGPEIKRSPFVLRTLTQGRNLFVWPSVGQVCGECASISFLLFLHIFKKNKTKKFEFDLIFNF